MNEFSLGWEKKKKCGFLNLYVKDMIEITVVQIQFKQNYEHQSRGIEMNDRNKFH